MAGNRLDAFANSKKTRSARRMRLPHSAWPGCFVDHDRGWTLTRSSLFWSFAPGALAVIWGSLARRHLARSLSYWTAGRANAIVYKSLVGDCRWISDMYESLSCLYLTPLQISPYRWIPVYLVDSWWRRWNWHEGEIVTRKLSWFGKWLLSQVTFGIQSLS